MKHRLESSLSGKISITSDMQITPTLRSNHFRYADDNILMAESEELKSLMKKFKEESEKTDLKLSILELSCKNCLYIFEMNPLSVASFAIIFSQSEDCLFTLLIVSFVVQKLLS